MNRTSLAHIERDQNLKAEREADARREEAWIASAREETAHLERQRGVELDCPKPKRGEARKPMRRKQGLEWLKDKGKLTAPQIEAGTRYGNDYRIAEDVIIRSVLNDTVRGGFDGPSLVVTKAKERLRIARKALGNHRGMEGVCNAICGIGLTINEFAGNRHDAEVCTVTLIIALDLLAEHYGVA